MTDPAPDGEYEPLRIHRPYVLPQPVGLSSVRRRPRRTTGAAGPARLALSVGIVAILGSGVGVAALGTHNRRPANAGASPPTAIPGPAGGDQDAAPSLASELPVLTPGASAAGAVSALASPDATPGQPIPGGQAPQPLVPAGMAVANPAANPVGNPAPPPVAAPPVTQPVQVPPPTTPPAGRALVNAESGKCLRADASDGAQAQLWSCDGSAAQQWIVMSDGTIRTGGFCLDAAWGTTYNGTRVQVARCSGNPAQQFTLNSAHDLINVQAAKCTDVLDHQSANGTPIQIWDCSGQSNQKWTLR